LLKEADDAYDEDKGTKLAAIRALGRSGEAGIPAIPDLLAVLKDGDPEELRAALEALSMFGEPATDAVQKAVAEHVAKLAKSPKPEEAKNAVALMASLSAVGVPTDSLEKLRALQATTSVTLSTQNGKQEKIQLAPKNVLIAVATWCPHSRALIDFLASEDVRRMTKGWTLDLCSETNGSLSTACYLLRWRRER